MNGRTDWVSAPALLTGCALLGGIGGACSLINAYPQVVPAPVPDAGPQTPGAIVVGGRIPAPGAGDAGDQFILTALDPSTGLELPGAQMTMTVSAIVYDSFGATQATVGSAGSGRDLWYVFQSGGGAIFPLPGEPFFLRTMELDRTTTLPANGGSQWHQVGQLQIPAGLSYATTAAALNYVAYVAYGDPNGDGGTGGCANGGIALPAASYALIVLDTSDPTNIQCAAVTPLTTQPVALIGTPPTDPTVTFGGSLSLAYKATPPPAVDAGPGPSDGGAGGVGPGDGAALVDGAGGDDGSASDADDDGGTESDGTASNDGSTSEVDGAAGQDATVASADSGGNPGGGDSGGVAAARCAPPTSGSVAHLTTYGLSHDPISNQTSIGLQSDIPIYYPGGATDLGFAAVLLNQTWGVLVATGAAQTGAGGGMLTFYPVQASSSPASAWCFPFADPVIKAPAIDPCSQPAPTAFVTGTNGTAAVPNQIYAILLSPDGGIVAPPTPLGHSGQTLSFEPSRSTLLAPYSEEDDNFELTAFAFDLATLTDGGEPLTREQTGSQFWNPPKVRPNFVATRSSVSLCAPP